MDVDNTVDFGRTERLRKILMLQYRATPEDEFQIIVFRELSKAVSRHDKMNGFLLAVSGAMIGLLLGHAELLVKMFCEKAMGVALLFLLLSICCGALSRYLSENRKICIDSIEGDLLDGVLALMNHHQSALDIEKANLHLRNRMPWYFFLVKYYLKQSANKLPYEIPARLAFFQAVCLSAQLLLLILSVAPFVYYLLF